MFGLLNKRNSSSTAFCWRFYSEMSNSLSASVKHLQDHTLDIVNNCLS
jgi:hypothetical protein